MIAHGMHIHAQAQLEQATCVCCSGYARMDVSGVSRVAADMQMKQAT